MWFTLLEYRFIIIWEINRWTISSFPYSIPMLIHVISKNFGERYANSGQIIWKLSYVI